MKESLLFLKKVRRLISESRRKSIRNPKNHKAKKILEALTQIDEKVVTDIRNRLRVPDIYTVAGYYKFDPKKLLKDLTEKVTKSYSMLRELSFHLEEIEGAPLFYTDFRLLLDEMREKKELLEARKSNKSKNKKWIQKAFKSGKVKRGKMHEVLNIPEDKDIVDVYKSPRRLAMDLKNKVGYTNAMRMLTFAANTSRKMLFKRAKKELMKMKSE